MGWVAAWGQGEGNSPWRWQVCDLSCVWCGATHVCVCGRGCACALTGVGALVCPNTHKCESALCPLPRQVLDCLCSHSSAFERPGMSYLHICPPYLYLSFPWEEKPLTCVQELWGAPRWLLSAAGALACSRAHAVPACFSFCTLGRRKCGRSVGLQKPQPARPTSHQALQLSP